MVEIAGTKLKKMTFDGQPVKKWVHDGVTVYKSAVPLVNVVGSNALQLSCSTWGSSAANYSNAAGDPVSVNAGHRYYARAAVATNYASNTSSTSADAFWGQGVTNNTSGSVAYILCSPGAGLTQTENTGHVIFTVPDGTTSVKPILSASTSANQNGNHSATYYMLVDISELEESTGITYTADSFWAAIGGEVFYDSIELET